MIPKPIQGPAGAVQTREWLYASRNPFTLFRLGVCTLLMIGLVPASPWLSRLDGAAHDLAVLGGGVGLNYFAFAEMLSAFFSAEGGRLALHLQAGAPAGSILAGKLAAALPYPLLTALATAAVALAAGWLRLRLLVQHAR